MTKKSPTYCVQTWDLERGCFTRQVGVPLRVYGFRGLLRAIRGLRRCGYTAHRNAAGNDPFVLIERETR